ncbi:hypothetical protein BKA66DRAFT_418270 [Pyrenochaeta sp. MPI-SDFR-AT-0127]|nr:hypothetical protein BKA66DRAFT_418270 [Pyrenochaeta sp. MPI-SDFR-AT-0127]
MGSKFSKAVRRPHVKAVASPVAIAQNHHESDKANETVARQDPAPQLPNVFSHDDSDIATSSSTQNTFHRRNSEPARPIAASSDTNTNMEHSPDRAAAFSLFLAEHRLMSIEYDATDPAPPPAVALPPPPPPPPPPPEEAEIVCLICCTQLPKEKDPRHVKEVVKPCKPCASAYCTSCVKNMFTEACKDLTRMPPRCCGQIHLHHARPYLSKEEVTEFKSKYEEWSTPNPFYCPIPTCSVFIPERLLPRKASSKGKRVDSGIGTPIANSFACPKCEAGICADCRQPAHPNNMCSVAEFGIDAETAALLKRWGYKKCPKCGHGLKRMFGCNHMECRCGAHFCWVCLESRDSCDGGCYDSEEGEYDSDDEPDEPDEPEQPVAQGDTTVPVPDGGAREAVTTVDTTQAPSVIAADTTTPPQAIPRPRNLDGGSHRYWEEQDMFFGDEPTDDIQDRSWHCHHDFRTYKIPLANALVHDLSAAEMECVKCWRTIQPEIEAPKNPLNAYETIVPAGAGRRGIWRARGRGRGRGRGRYMPPRGLFRADATVGTAAHLTTVISPLSQSVPTREASPMEDIQYSTRVVDTYGNIITTVETELPRRASLDNSQHSMVDNGEPSGKQPLDGFPFTFNAPSVLGDAISKFSLAHECRDCGLLVCEPCRDVALAHQKADEEPEEINISQPLPT